MQSFVHNYEVPGLLEDLLVVDSQKPTHIDQRVLFRAHRAAVRLRTHFSDNGGNGTALLAGFSLLNEVRIFGDTRSVKDNTNSVSLRQLPYGFEVL